tara:strand:- start:19683 stop:20738 length:1056 start_codon:yes stop_codon:yes gene_type:complete
MDAIQDEALQVAETAARLTFGTKLKRVPRVIFSKISLPVLSVVAIVVFIYGSTVDVLAKWNVAAEMNGGHSQLLSFWSLEMHEYILSATVAVGMVMYGCCVYRDPGKVPGGYQPDPESLQARGAVVERKRKGGSRFCKKCVRHKPPRTHHCRQCNKCVLRMDHHCVWVNNCIGHRNYKSFFLFLLYITISCWHASGLLVSHVWFASGDSSDSSNEKYKKYAASSVPIGIAEVFSLTLAVPLTLALTLLLAWHVYLVSHNKTTIEHYEGVRSSHNSENGLPPLHSVSQKTNHPYSLGLRANLREILGNRVICWLAPGCSIAGDGLAFANANDYATWKATKERKEDELTFVGE